MSFEGLLGNQQTKENLLAAIGRGSISHFYLIAGPKGSGKKTLARLLAAAIMCQGEHKPCLACNPCRKVMADTHPDLITIADPERKTVPVKTVRAYREEMFIKPNEAEKKIYLLPQELNIEGQNALLKIFEEPPKHGVFILLTDNPESLLPTVRSRCTMIRMQGLSEDVLRSALSKEFPTASKSELDAAIWRSGGFLGQAKELLQEGVGLSKETLAFSQAYAAADHAALLQVLLPLEKAKRDHVISVINQWVQLLQQALLCRNGMPVLSAEASDLAVRRNPKDINEAIGILKKAIEYLQGNVSTAAVCGHLQWALHQNPNQHK